MKKDCSECKHFDEFHTSRVCHKCKPWGEQRVNKETIYRADTLEMLCKFHCGFSRPIEQCYSYRTNYCEIANAIRAVSSAEAVEVVRCKDCKHYSVKGKTTQFGFCGYRNAGTDETDYCSRAVRREP